MDHDRLFKELLRTFFAEFLELFLPQVAQYIEPGSLEFLDKEIFTDVTSEDRHEVDLLVKCRFRGQETFFLIHVSKVWLSSLRASGASHGASSGTFFASRPILSCACATSASTCGPMRGIVPR